VTTRAGTDTMARRGTHADEDDIAEADDTADASTFGGASIRGTRQVTPSAMPDDLRTVLTLPTTFGTKLFDDVLNVSGALAALLMGTYLGIRHFPSRDLVSRKGCSHPCRQAAFFLPCARPPDVLRLRFGRPRNHRGAYVRRAFVLTRSGFHTMPSGRGDRDDANDVSVTASGASSSSLRDPPEAPDDLKATLTDPADDEFGTKIFMTLELKDFEPSPVTDAGQLLTLRSDFLNNWALNTSGSSCSRQLNGPPSPQLKRNFTLLCANLL
jgi:hypothetical protein